MYTSLPHNSENGNSVLITLACERETNSCLFPADGMLLLLLITLTYTHQLPGAPSHLHRAPMRLILTQSGPNTANLNLTVLKVEL